MLKLYKPLFPIFKQQLWWMIFSIGLSSATILSSIGLMSLSGWFISTTAYAALSYQVAMQFNFFLPATGVRFFSLARTANRYGERVISHQATFKILSDLRVWVYQKLEPLAPAHLIAFRRGDLLNRMVSDIDQLDHLFIRILSPTITAIIIILASFIFLLFFDLRIALLTSISLFISGFILPFIIHIISNQTAKKINQISTQLKTETLDMIHGHAELIIFNQLDLYNNKLLNLNNQLIKLQQKMTFFDGLGQALIQTILFSTITIAIVLAIIDVTDHQLNGAMIALIVLTILASYEAVINLPLGYQYLGKTNQAAKRLSELNQLEPQVKFNNLDNIHLDHYDIKFENIRFSHQNRKPIFENFNLSINEKTKTTLVGKTGSGKSSLLQLLSRVWDPQEGSITIGGINIKLLSEKQLRSLIVYIEAEAHLFNQSIKDNLAIANDLATDNQLYDALEQVGLKDFVLSLPNKLDTIIGEFGQNLSGGQRKRIMLARALITQAPIILLDEPTENLDSASEMKVIKAIDQIAKNKTLIISTHSQMIISKTENSIYL